MFSKKDFKLMSVLQSPGIYRYYKLIALRELINTLRNIAELADTIVYNDKSRENLPEFEKFDYDTDLKFEEKAT